MAKKQLLLRLDADLYTAIEKYAQRQHLSVNSSITSLLATSIEREGSLEQRRFVGLTIDGNQITPTGSLVEVKGIYYRFKLLNTTNIEHAHEFKIIDVQDNTLLLSDISIIN